MFATSAVFFIAGALCLLLVGFAFYKLRPQEGQAQSAWVSSDFRGSVVAMGLLILVIIGVSLLIKGIAA
jgi:uncharacterized membrane protein YidH (DUF202 family)